MSSLLSKDDVEDLLINVIGVTKIMYWKGDKIQFCCPVHGESRPSCGINISLQTDDGDIIQVYNCLSCGSSGTLPWLLYQSLPDDFSNLNQAIDFINDRYGVDFDVTQLDRFNLKYFEDIVGTKPVRFELPLSTIASYRSGKETYSYFYSRGFTKETVKKFMVGRDLVNKTVTVPVFWGDNKLAGVIGRYISPKRAHNERFKIYEFPKGTLLFPLNHFHTENGEIILVEGLFDAIMMHQLGYRNTLSTLTSSISKAQVKLIKGLGDTVIDFLDNDRYGRDGADSIRRKLKGVTWNTVDFPEYGKDPCDWLPDDIEYSLSTKRLTSVKLCRL